MLTIAYVVMQKILMIRIENGDPKNDFFHWTQYVLSLLNLLVWFRIISYLRIFKATRALIRLVVEVLKDIRAFALVLCLALMAFSVSFSILTFDNYNFEYQRETFLTKIKHMYLLMYGDFNVDEYDEASAGKKSASLWLLFVLSSIFMPLIMLNMLIAIMSDTYEKVVTQLT